jgi:hypothetical protein
VPGGGETAAPDVRAPRREVLAHVEGLERVHDVIVVVVVVVVLVVVLALPVVVLELVHA